MSGKHHITLLESNLEWAVKFAGEHPVFFEKSASEQKPKILWIGCSDSRVPESVVLNVHPGVVFTHRNIANQVPVEDLNLLAVLQYAIQKLGVRHVCVVGHTGCGGAEAAYDMATKKVTTPDGPIEKWLDDLCQMVFQHNLNKLPKEKAVPLIVKENVKRQMSKLLKVSVIRKASAGKDPVHIHGWLYNLSDGKIQDLNINPKSLLSDDDMKFYEDYVWVRLDC